MRRMRWSLLAAVVLMGCPEKSPIVAGAPCTSETVGRCDLDAPRLLQCTMGTYQIYADCYGPKGCSVTSDTAECDISGNSIGSHCPPTSEGKVRCDPDGGLSILRCVSGTLKVEFACPDASVCGLTDAGLTCVF